MAEPPNDPPSGGGNAPTEPKDHPVHPIHPDKNADGQIDGKDEVMIGKDEK